MKLSSKSGLPSVVCIGAQKAGTSWLHENLAQHPQIWAPPFKELHFFDYKFVEDSHKWGRWHVKSNIRSLLKNGEHDEGYKTYLKSLAEEPILNGNWYKKVFSQMPKGSFGLDVTPEYCSLPPEGISFFRKFLGNPLIVYIIRNPLERAISQIKMNISRKKLARSIENWKLVADDPVIESRGDYRSYIPRWDGEFKDVLYIPFKDIAENPIGVLRDVETRLGLDQTSYASPERAVFQSSFGLAPDSVRDDLSHRLRVQDEFLIARFGEGFYSRC